MLSTQAVQTLLKDFVRVKSDPRARNVNRSLYQKYKSTQYVPEVVFVSPDGKSLGLLKSRELPGAVAEMEAVLRRVRRARG